MNTPPTAEECAPCGVATELDPAPEPMEPELDEIPPVEPVDDPGADEEEEEPPSPEEAANTLAAILIEGGYCFVTCEDSENTITEPHGGGVDTGLFTAEPGVNPDDLPTVQATPAPAPMPVSAEVIQRMMGDTGIDLTAMLQKIARESHGKEPNIDTIVGLLAEQGITVDNLPPPPTAEPPTRQLPGLPSAIPDDPADDAVTKLAKMMSHHGINTGAKSAIGMNDIMALADKFLTKPLAEVKKIEKKRKADVDFQPFKEGKLEGYMFTTHSVRCMLVAQKMDNGRWFGFTLQQYPKEVDPVAADVMHVRDVSVSIYMGSSPRQMVRLYTTGRQAAGFDWEDKNMGVALPTGVLMKDWLKPMMRCLKDVHKAWGASHIIAFHREHPIPPWLGILGSIATYSQQVRQGTMVYIMELK